MSGVSHVTKVRRLYKVILKLHRGLPMEMQAIGDEYVRDEFRRHKTANELQTKIFMNEWSGYCVTLAQQLGKRTASQQLGMNLQEDQFEKFTDEQIAQLFELYEECNKPVNPEDPLGENPNVKT